MEQVKQKKKGNLAVKIILRVLLAIFCVVCVFFIFFNVTHSYFRVYGPSMAPTLNKNETLESECIDGVFVSKIKSYSRGDIIVAKREAGESFKFVIKRIIAISGDKIKIEEIDGVNRVVLIKDGEEESIVLEEEYLNDYSVNEYLFNSFNNMVQNGFYTLDENGFLEIEEGYVFYLGDNRKKSKDSSVYGPVKKENIVGKVDYIIYNNTNMYGQVIGQIFGW